MRRLWWMWILIGAGLASGLSAPARADDRAAATSEGAARSALAQRARDLGLDPGALDAMRVVHASSRVQTRTRHLYLRAQLGGIDVLGGDLQVTLHEPDERALAARIPDAARAALFEPAAGPRRARHSPVLRLDEHEALRRAALALDLPVPAAIQRERAPQGPDARGALFAAEVSDDPVPVRLVWRAAADGTLRLCWSLDVRTRDRAHAWHVEIDVETGEVAYRNDRIASDTWRVFPPPIESPAAGARALVPEPADPLASPFGWRDVDGIPGPEFLDTRGNNVEAQEDRDANDAGGNRPRADASGRFDFALDFGVSPTDPASESAAVANLFFWTNWLHDAFYRLGFDEAAGNFQSFDYFRGGVNGDPVLADAQDGSGRNNANFETQPDGTPGRLQMFLFDGPAVELLGPDGTLRFPAGPAEFGAALDATGFDGTLVAARDDAGVSPFDLCEPISNAAELAGRIALIDRGICLFIDKVRAVQAAGAIGAVIANQEGDALFVMSGVDPAVTIPSALVGRSDGDLLRAALAGAPSVRLRNAERDGAFDNGVVAHEYGHGVSNRLTGGPQNADCLGIDSPQSRGMGEGWSDFWTLAFTALPEHTAQTPREIGAWATSGRADAPGFRNFPYTIDPTANPQVYSDIGFTNRPHGVGELWALGLWHLYWKLVDRYGFDDDLQDGSGGNNLAMRLVIDGMALQPCNPTFVAGRNAILLADSLGYGGAHQCDVWDAFAERGVGLNATDGGGAASLAVTDSFLVPAGCAAPACGDGLIGGTERCDVSAPGLCAAGCTAECRCASAGVCGDLGGDGAVAGADLELLRAALLDPADPAAATPGECTAASPSGGCDLLGAVLLERALAGLLGDLDQRCAPL